MAMVGPARGRPRFFSTPVDFKGLRRSWMVLTLFVVLNLGIAKDVLAANEKFFVLQNVVTPVQNGMNRQAATLGFARSGETYAVLSQEGQWVQIKFSEGKTGWLPMNSGKMTDQDGSRSSVLPVIFGGLLGLAMGGLIAMAIARWMETRRQRQAAEKLLFEAQSRRGKRILAVLHDWPEVGQTLDGDSRPMLSLLKEWGYTVVTVSTPENVLAKVRNAQPNILMALSKDAARIESAIAKDAALTNTPVIYLGEKPPRLTEGFGVRLHWMLGGNDKALSEVLGAALRRSPKTIRHGVRTEGMRGELVGGGLWEILHFLAALRKSGNLKVETVNLKGEVHLARGDILFARMGDLADAEAVEGMLNIEEGQFAFFETRGPSQGKGLNTEKLLLDWAKHRDEINDGHGT